MKKDYEQIELRSEKVRNIIGRIPPSAHTLRHYDYHGIARKPCCGRLFLFQLLLYGMNKNVIKYDCKCN